MPGQGLWYRRRQGGSVKAHRTPLAVADLVFGGFALLLILAVVLGWGLERGGLESAALLTACGVTNLVASAASRSSRNPLPFEVLRAVVGGALATAIYVVPEGPVAGWWGAFLIMCVGGSLVLGMLTGSATPGRALVAYYFLLFTAAEMAGRESHDWFAFSLNGGTLVCTGLVVAETVARLGASLASEHAHREALLRSRAASEELMRRQADAAARASIDSALRFVVEGTAASTGHDFFQSLVRSLAAALDVRHAFVAEVAGDPLIVRTLAFWSDGRLVPNVEYSLRGTPCEGVIAGDLCFYPQRVRARFPDDADLVTMNADSYLGSPIVNRDGTVLGHVAVVDDRPMWDEQWRTAVLRIFGARAGAELERQRVEERLRVLNDALSARLASAAGAST